MEVVSGISAFAKSGYPLYLALGNFDGVHTGHRAIISSVVKNAAAAGGKSAVLVFDPHPLRVLLPEQPFALLHSLPDRVDMLGRAGLDYVIIHPFCTDFARLGPREFAGRVLHDDLAVSGVVVGFNYSFGRDGRGKPADLVRFGEEMGFSVEIVPSVLVAGAPVASSRIRALLSMGKVEEARAMLGYSFYLRGLVVHGDGRGRSLGFPTANVQPEPGIIRPGNGVYLTLVTLADEESGPDWALTNIGQRPTFCKKEAAVEVYLLDREKNLYGRELKVSFLQKIREEKTFPGAGELTQQIRRDVARARRLIARRYACATGNVANDLRM
jgi:riboflavin kinase/FMN adenylyltransferase